MHLILIGYWVNTSKYMFASTNKYAEPSKLQDPEFWKSRNKEGVIKYLEAATRINFQKGWSNCRICGAHLGSSEATDGKYAWPHQFEHYIKSHDVKIPEEFYAHIESNSFKLPDYDLNGTFHKLNEAPWIEYSKKYLTDFLEKKEDVELRQRSLQSGKPMFIQETIERFQKDIRTSIDEETIKQITKKEKDQENNG